MLHYYTAFWTMASGSSALPSLSLSIPFIHWTLCPETNSLADPTNVNCAISQQQDAHRYLPLSLAVRAKPTNCPKLELFCLKPRG